MDARSKWGDAFMQLKAFCATDKSRACSDRSERRLPAQAAAVLRWRSERAAVVTQAVAERSNPSATIGTASSPIAVFICITSSNAHLKNDRATCSDEVERDVV